jgi:hypothetical protein
VEAFVEVLLNSAADEIATHDRITELFVKNRTQKESLLAYGSGFTGNDDENLMEAMLSKL